jgi:hypothetical protein
VRAIAAGFCSVSLQYGPMVKCLFFMNSENWKDLAIQFNGKHVKGRYDVAGEVVTVITWNGIKKAQLGKSSAEKVAKILLRELASEAN